MLVRHVAEHPLNLRCTPRMLRLRADVGRYGARRGGVLRPPRRRWRPQRLRLTAAGDAQVDVDTSAPVHVHAGCA